MKYKIFLTVFVIGLLSSLILASNDSTGICETGAGCELVNNSNYGSTFGIKNSLYGVFIFSFMILITAWHMRNPNRHTKKIIHAAVIIGSIISLYFLYLQFFVIRIFCEFCLLVDFSLLVALLFLFWLWEH